MDTLENVKEFMLLFKQPVLKSATIPTEARIKLRLSLSLEELSELAESAAALEDYKILLQKKLLDVGEKIISNKYNVPDINGILDALVDMRYVNDGAIHEFGLGNIFNEAFNIVQESNMSKVCNNQEEALKTQEFYLDKGTTTFIQEHNNKFIVYRSGDSKVLKSINYKEANFDNLI